MLLHEIKIGKEHGEARSQEQYWVLFNKDTIHSIPKRGNDGIDSDIFAHFLALADGDKKQAQKTASEFKKVDYAKSHSYGCCTSTQRTRRSTWTLPSSLGI